MCVVKTTKSFRPWDKMGHAASQPTPPTPPQAVQDSPSSTSSELRAVICKLCKSMEEEELHLEQTESKLQAITTEMNAAFLANNGPGA
jgi:hypothetical protein